MSLTPQLSNPWCFNFFLHLTLSNTSMSTNHNCLSIFKSRIFSNLCCTGISSSVSSVSHYILGFTNPYFCMSTSRVNNIIQNPITDCIIAILIQSQWIDPTQRIRSVTIEVIPPFSPIGSRCVI